MAQSHRQRLSAGLGIILFVLAAGVFGASGERAAKEAELKQLRERIRAVQQELTKARTDHDRLRAVLRETEQQIGRISAKVRDLDGKLKLKTKKLKSLNEEQAGLEASVAEQKTHLAGQVRAAYAMGRQEYLKILLNQEDPALVGRIFTYYDYLNRARSRRIGNLEKSLQRLQAVRTEIEVETERLRSLRVERVEQKAHLESSRQERSALLARLKSQIDSKDKELQRMSADEKALRELITALSAALEDIPAEPGNRRPFSSQRGKLKWPAKGPLLVRYGSPRNLGEMKWQGVLIGGHEGQKVQAVSHGRVAFADWLRGYGLLLIIDHGDGYMSLYGHNESLLKETGDWVETGEVIATVGASGGQERNALYFEIRHNGRPTDPIRWCRR